MAVPLVKMMLESNSNVQKHPTMKSSITPILSVILISASVTGLAQGTVNFANFGVGINAPVFLCDGTTKATWPYMAQLYAGPSPAELEAVGSPATFLTGGGAGYFSGGYVSIPTVPPGGTAWVRVVVWDSTAGGTITNATPQQAFEHMAATGGSDGWRQSGCFSVVTGGYGYPPTPPASLVGLSFCCPCGCAWDPFLFYGFTAQPESQTVAIGSTVTFTATALACHTPGYTWYFNANPVTGGPSLIITNVQPSDAGAYFALAGFTGIASYTSHTATLTVLVPPTITSAPQSRTAEAGSVAGFAVQFAGSAPLECQWFFNATNALPNATNSVLHLSDIQPAQSGAYSVMVTNLVGAATSPPAMLSVIAPVERRLIPALGLTGQPGTSLNLDFADAVTPVMDWHLLSAIALTNTPQLYVDVSSPLPPERFYRAWQTGGPPFRPGLDLRMVPAITLTGAIGSTVRLDAINMVGPTDAWFTVATVVLTNTSRVYPDVSSIGQPPRLWRVVPLP